MIELEEGFSANDRYLINEYLKNGTDDFLLADIGDKTFVVPYKYRMGAKDEVSAIVQFKKVLLDFQQAEVRKYQDVGAAVRMERYDGVDYVVPFSAREQLVSPQKLADYTARQAAAKYDMIIETCRKLEERGVGLKAVDFSSAALASYQHRLEMVCRQDAQNAARVQRFCAGAKGKKSKKFGVSTENIARQVGALAERALNGVKKYPKTAGVSFLIGASVLGGNLLPRGCSESKDEYVEVVPIETMQDSGKYVDFRGEEHSDTFGNIARIMDMKAEITAMLIAVEGYADTAYDDGTGVMTIGSGTTFYLDEHGKHQKVSRGDEITPEQAMTHKWRFIESEMLDLLGDKMGRSCSDEELMACVGAGFCWGSKALGKSEFYRSVCQGEEKTQQMRKLTGFRKQKGLLKRSYLLAACLNGEWTAKDLLDMPLYKYKDYGYLNSGIYRLELGDIMSCKSGKDGKLLKDGKGNHIPIIGEDGFCSFHNNKAEIKQKILQKAKYSLSDKKRVRDFMPQEMLQTINMRANSAEFAFQVCQQSNVGR